MTLTVSIQTKDSIWLVTDRRLSYQGRRPVDTAIKATIVEVTGGIALVGYAGLGATGLVPPHGLGNQPSQWVGNVLRGRHLPLEQMLEVIADAMQREFLPHLKKIPATLLRQHCFLVPAFVESKPLVFAIALALTPDGNKFTFARCTKGGTKPALQITAPTVAIGSGAPALSGTDWQRSTLRLVNAYNRKKISAQTVADHLASLTYLSHQKTKDETVGPSSLVVWRNSETGSHKGGGMHSFYALGKRVSDATEVPWIKDGSDMAAIFAIIEEEVFPDLRKMVVAAHRGEHTTEFDKDRAERAMNENLSKLPSNPDEKLR